ncbi:MAG: fumarate reductase/succinate dehydrogenase flavoprotein subunit, partial [Terriglobia bacterium]
EHAAIFAKQNGAGGVCAEQVEAAARQALEPFGRPSSTEGPYQVQRDLQQTMNDLVGIVRREPELKQACEALQKLRTRAQAVSVEGNREYNPGWHTACDLDNLLTISEAVARAALERKESRGAHFRDDYPAKDERFAKVNIQVRMGAGGEMHVEQTPAPAIPPELAMIIEEMK